MRRRSPRSSRPPSVSTFNPSIVTRPASGSISRRMVRPTVDLPHPDSPTRPSVWPAGIAKETSSTARTTVRGRPSPKNPRSPGKCLTSPSTSTSAAADDVTGGRRGGGGGAEGRWGGRGGRELHRARERRRGQRQDMDTGLQLLQPLLLRDAGMLRLGDHDQAEMLEPNAPGEQRMRADDNVDLAFGQL